MSNHVHTLDCTMNALAMFPRKVHFTSLKSNFHIPVAGGILHFVGVIPVADKVSEMPIFLQEVKELVKKNVYCTCMQKGNSSTIMRDCAISAAARS